MNKINAEMKLLIEDVTLCYSDTAMQKNNVAQNENPRARAVVVLSF
ncbi:MULTISPECIES: hypothetical protein [Raoultella]|jgi:hypothetical protein|nr:MULTISPECIES: hypothetical protein [Raoultella]MCS4271702.1 hypothetical protein [Raoultella sp. BIGb0132]MCS4287989.1 hypothetical protein [Raoultella terrigena]